MKVFATRTAFTAEAALLCNTASPLRAFMPALLALHDNPAGALQSAAGAPLPPCIVMEKGEPLDIFCHSRNPSRSLAFMVWRRSPHRPVLHTSPAWFNGSRHPFLSSRLSGVLQRRDPGAPWNGSCAGHVAGE